MDNQTVIDYLLSMDLCDRDNFFQLLKRQLCLKCYVEGCDGGCDDSWLGDCTLVER